MFIRELLALYVYNYFEMINPTCSFSLPLSFGILKYLIILSIMSYLFISKITTKSILNRFMASHPDRRPTYDQQISSDQIVRPRTKSVIPKNKVPNLTNLPHSFKREKFKCIKREDNELNAHLIKYSDIKKEVSCYKN